MDFLQLHIISFCSRKETISKVAEDIVWQKEHLYCWVMFPSLIVWEKKKKVGSLRKETGPD